MAEATEKKSRKPRTSKAPNVFILIKTSGAAEAVPATDLVKALKEAPGSKIFTLGKEVVSVEMSSNLISGESGKIKLKFKK